MENKGNVKKIKVMPRGPYEVSAEIPLRQEVIVGDETGASERWEKGKTYENKENYYLCRCGHSKNKPYCDATHREIGFDGFEKAGHRPYTADAKVYRGPEVDLLDNEKLCAVARFCDADPTTWDSAIHSDEPGLRDTAIEKAAKCPSGRLTAVQKDGTLIEPELEQEIGLIEDAPQNCRGPLWVKGRIPVEDADGKSYEVRNRVTLCRCGESHNMPFCDASHLRAPHMKGLDE